MTERFIILLADVARAPDHEALANAYTAARKPCQRAGVMPALFAAYDHAWRRIESDEDAAPPKPKIGRPIKGSSPRRHRLSLRLDDETKEALDELCAGGRSPADIIAELILDAGGSDV
jgi:hypothetical protein